MKSQQKSILQPKKPPSKSTNGGGEYSELILPIELLTDILLRLPAKSIARFRCVSKLWASILRCPDFTELFFTRSSSRPQVLFAFYKGNDVFFYSIPQPQIHDEKTSPVTATYITKAPIRDFLKSFSNINSLVFISEEWLSEPLCNATALMSVICSPSTGQSLTIPKLPSMRKCFLGYDPTKKQYKILSVTSTGYQVLTLGCEKLLWRDIVRRTEHYPIGNVVCINGVLYFRVMVKKYGKIAMVVCFDIRSEKLQFMKVMEKFRRGMKPKATLINYDGKLGSIIWDTSFMQLLELWVLEDPKKQEWSQYIHKLPPSVGEDYNSFVVGMIGTDELVLTQSNYENDSLYVIYYNMMKNSVVKVEIQGIEAYKGSRVATFLNHIEDLKLLSPTQSELEEYDCDDIGNPIIPKLAPPDDDDDDEEDEFGF